MRTIMIFGVAAMAVATMALVDISPALAEIHEGIGLCKKNEPLLCKSENLITVPSGGSIEVVTEAKEPFLTGTLTEKCNASQLTFRSSEEDKNPVLGQITAFTFSGSCTPCSTVKVLALPYSTKLSMKNVGEKEDYVLTTSGGWELTGCTFGVTCKFEGTGVTLLGVNTTEGLEFKAEEEELKQTGGSAMFCGSAGKWTANYKGIAADLLDKEGKLIAEHKGPLWLTLMQVHETHEGIGICKKNEPLLCAPGNLITAPSEGSIDVYTEAKNPILKGTLTEKCNSSRATLKTSEEDKNPVLAQITALTFAESCTPCSTVKVLSLPYSAKLSMAKVGASEDYVLTVDGGAELSGCTFGVTCKFEGTGVTLLGVNTTEGLEFKAEEEELKQTTGNPFFCGSTGKWTASYKATAVDLLDSTGKFVAEDKGPFWLTLLEES